MAHVASCKGLAAVLGFFAFWNLAKLPFYWETRVFVFVQEGRELANA